MRELRRSCDVAVSDPLTDCEMAAKKATPDDAMMVGVYVPQCDEEGYYRPLQFHPSSGYRWCVDEYGNKINGTHTAPGLPAPACSQYRGYYQGFF